jgi:PKD repeat protein
MKHKFVLSTLAACTLLGLAAGPAFAAAQETNPYSPANGHAYRHGVLPTRDVLNKMNHWKTQNALTAQTAATGIETLSYGGALDGVGVMSGKVKVYIVYYGTQWGTRSTNASGDSVFTGDASGGAAKAEEMFKGIGTNSELWSADLTQWCDGPNVTSGATSCPSNASFVPYQSGGTLAGVWYDNTKASPATATQAQLAAEAVSAAAHFGNTASGSNRYTYYIIMSPHGTNPDSYQGSYCAWHDYTTSSYGDLAYSNQPYNMDSGQGCGVNFVNSGSAGTLDGYTMTLGHEWQEMMSDTYPAGGWTNHTGNATYNGQENSDECAWIAAGSPGGAANITFATGTFTEQASWSNDTNACAITHPIVGGGTGGGTPVANFTDTISGLTVNFTDSSTDSGGTISAHSWTFGDGGTSTATSPSHTYAAAGTYSVTETVTDSVSGATNSKTASVTVSSGGGGSSQLLGNTGFESGTASPWSMSSGVLCSNSTCSGEVAHAGTWFAWLDGYGSAHTDTVSQSVAIPSGKTSATLSYALHINTSETGSTAYDTLKVQVLNSSGTVLATLATYSNVNAASGYTVHTANLAAYIGQTVTIKFTGTEDSSLQTSFVLDDVTLTVQ